MTFAHISRASLSDLVVLDVLLETHSTTEAARRVHLTQPAVSRALARLRQVFGDELLGRTARGLRPTPRALALRPRLHDLLRELDALVAAGEAFDPATAAITLRVACPDYVELTVLAPLLRRLARVAPGVSLQVVPLPRVTDRDLEAGGLDLVFSPRRPAAAGVVWTPLLDEPYVALVDRARAPAALTLDELARRPHVFVAPAGEPGAAIDDLLAARGRTRRIAVQVSSFLTVPHFLIGTDRVAIVPDGAARALAALHPVRARALPIKIPPVTICAGWHELRRDDPAHRWFRGVLVEPSARRRSRPAR